MDGITESALKRGHLACHCLLVESSNGLILIDTGFGLKDVRDPRSRLSRFFLQLVSPEFREEMTAIRQIERLGFAAQDVRHILMTHLDFDHAGGLDDFPEAEVHMLQGERDYAFKQKTWLDRQRFRPQQWSYRENWNVYQAGQGDSWFGFERVQNLKGVPPEIVLIPLIGHTFGHAGIAIRDGDHWKLLAGDAYFFHAEMHLQNPWCTPGLKFYQTMMEKDRKARLTNQTRLRELIRRHSSEVEIFCSHDVIEFERVSGRLADVSIEKLSPAERRIA
jgi:glyoxylase-like metal-dependent hydrolase (beta-lactamase superfamily II)